MSARAVPDELRLGLWGGGDVGETVHGAELDSHEPAWAAGFFDGEGCTMNRGDSLRMTVVQTERTTLDRFARAIGQRGRIDDARPNGDGHSPIYCWRAGARRDVQAVLTVLWPYLSGPKRTQAAAAFAAYRAANTRRISRPQTVEERTRHRVARQTSLGALVLAAIAGGAATQVDIQRALRCGRNEALGVLADLVTRGAVMRTGGGRRGQPYTYRPAG